MPKILITEEIVTTFKSGCWERVVFAEFASTLRSKEWPFPCIFGVNGFETGQLRFGFSVDADATEIAEMLRMFLPRARSYGQNTSLVIFTAPQTVLSLEEYKVKFWNLLKAVSALDSVSWPQDIPTTIDDSHWEFCFNGEPIFVVCNTPAHVHRQSRRSSTFMLTFQPRWVFDNILGNDKSADLAFSKVRGRLKPYDFISASPTLGRYGSKTNREFAQYFLEETNIMPKCPFANLRG
ncbi:uncharacterized protein SRCM100623_02509 [Acetobacter pasteurianus]|uniref:YqcI/YcgG family protein n=2 Tax=Acetobacter pasteurianus TaxID=438 RepID=A0A1A0CSN4_ACEPA|nr:YqcI/YcgG family protein [Acetobacter pasteurianus]OAZ65919.1 uncharacterized protein SRCM100623_02509 [Acetobacter pasteurianus]